MEMEVDGDVPPPPQGGAPPGAVKCPYCPLEVKSLDRHTMRAHKDRHKAGRSMAPTAFQCQEVPVFPRGCCSSLLTTLHCHCCAVRG